MDTDLVEFRQFQEVGIFSYLRYSLAKSGVNGWNVLRLVLAVNSVSKALNRVEKIPICVAVNSATRGFHVHVNSDVNIFV